MKLNLLLLLLFCCENLIQWSTAQSPDDLYTCEALTDPHIRTWYPNGQGGSNYKNCLAAGMYDLVRNRYVVFNIRVSNWWMVDIYLTFFNGSSIRPICTIISTNFEVELSDGCDLHGITHVFLDSGSSWLLTVTYLKAGFSMTTTHSRNSYPQPSHFNINIYQTKALVDASTGICTGESCASRKRRSVSSTSPPNQLITREKAEEICQVYIRNYLNNQNSRAAQQRNARFSDTIEMIRQACIFDVNMTGIPEVAAGSMEILMVAERTSNITRLEDIQESITADGLQALEHLNNVTEQSKIEVQTLLTTTSAVKTTTDTTSTTTICSPACASYQQCISGVCVGQGTLSFTLQWSRVGDGDIILTIPNGNTIMYNQRGPSYQTNFGQLDVDDRNGMGPENIFWNSTQPDRGTYLICFQQFSFNPFANPESPITAVVKVKQNGQAPQTFTKTFTQRMPAVLPNVCQTTYDTYLGSFVY